MSAIFTVLFALYKMLKFIDLDKVQSIITILFTIVGIIAFFSWNMREKKKLKHSIRLSQIKPEKEMVKRLYSNYRDYTDLLGIIIEDSKLMSSDTMHKALRTLSQIKKNINNAITDIELWHTDDNIYTESVQLLDSINRVVTFTKPNLEILYHAQKKIEESELEIISRGREKNEKIKSNALKRLSDYDMDSIANSLQVYRNFIRGKWKKPKL